MGNLLQEIIRAKQSEIAQTRASKTPLRTKFFPGTSVPGLSKTKKTPLKQLFNSTRPGIIAEFKRKSPSGGEFPLQRSMKEILLGYESSGAIAVSVLTDKTFFGGSLQDLKTASQLLRIPVLRKDFIIDASQVYESKYYGADIILLIASCLTPEKSAELAKIAKRIGLEVFLELRPENNFKDYLSEHIDFVGINNRNLDSLSTNPYLAAAFADKIPDCYIKIAESGISTFEQLDVFRKSGYRGFLIGEHFLRSDNPADELQLFNHHLINTVYEN